MRPGQVRFLHSFQGRSPRVMFFGYFAWKQLFFRKLFSRAAETARRNWVLTPERGANPQGAGGFSPRTECAFDGGRQARVFAHHPASGEAWGLTLHEKRS